jgi:very-short-patch-repair endonuclease
MQKPEAVLAQLAQRRHGAVARHEVLAHGLTPKMIEWRISVGHLVPVHPGVYLVGLGPPSPLAYEAAAILACRPRALLGASTAASHWKLPTARDGQIDVMVVGRGRRPLEGVRVRAISELARGELRYLDGLPLSSPSLTLLDLAGMPGYAQLPEALNEARVQRIVTDGDLRATLAAHPTRRGAGALRRLLDSEQGPRILRSTAERKALRVMREHAIEPDGSDVQIGPYRVDFWFERERVAVEVDGYRYHGTPKRFVDDRRRTGYLAGLGIQVYPLTWNDLGPGVELAMADLKRALVSRRTP